MRVRLLSSVPALSCLRNGGLPSGRSRAQRPVRFASPLRRGPRLADIELQPASLDIWDSKYRLKTKTGEPLDRDIEDTYRRVARTLADVETTPEAREHWYERFCEALRHGAVPAGRIISNAGAQDHKPATSTINCTVSAVVRDSMDDILKKVHEAGLTLKAGCGIGYEFSTLRPRGAWVSGAGAHTSGPLSFMDIYDAMCFTVSSAGGRRGAQMATFDVGHPDAMEFIRAKREDGRLRQFNLSLLITREFVDAVRNDLPWKLAFPMSASEREQLDLDDPEQVVWRRWPAHFDSYTRTTRRAGSRAASTGPFPPAGCGTRSCPPPTTSRNRGSFSSTKSTR